MTLCITVNAACKKSVRATSNLFTFRIIMVGCTKQTRTAFSDFLPLAVVVICSSKQAGRLEISFFGIVCSSKNRLNLAHAATSIIIISNQAGNKPDYNPRLRSIHKMQIHKSKLYYTVGNSVCKLVLPKHDLDLQQKFVFSLLFSYFR